MHTGRVADDEQFRGLRAAYDVDRWQKIRNARPIPERRLQTSGHILVRARIVWEHDGEQWIDTVAFAWTSRLVLVQLVDQRYLFRGVWLDPSDVERR